MHDSLNEIQPAAKLPIVHSAGAIDPELCRKFTGIAEPLMLASRGLVEVTRVCDQDRALSDMTQLVLDETIKKIGSFTRPVFAAVAGYNMPQPYCSASEIDYHSDGLGVNELGIVSMSGRGVLYLAWKPRCDQEDDLISTRTYFDEDRLPHIGVYRDNNFIGRVQPVDVINCVPGTVVKINEQKGTGIVDENGWTWQLQHGLFQAVGSRISLQFREIIHPYASSEIKQGNIPRLGEIPG
jgi:hypothetical protein